jgi:hypothetical protein
LKSATAQAVSRPATCCPRPRLYASTANDGCLTQDIPGAIALLDEAGIVDTDGDGIREYEGTPLRVLYQTSTNAVRQDTQALIKQWWAEIGIDTELRNIDASVFFGGDPASPDTFQKFYADIEMYTNNFAVWTRKPTWQLALRRLPRPDTQWQGSNIQRFCIGRVRRARRRDGQTADLGTWPPGREMNDMMIQSYSIIPLIHRGGVSAHANSLGGVRMSDWDSELWNIAEWYPHRRMNASDLRSCDRPRPFPAGMGAVRPRAHSFPDPKQNSFMTRGAAMLSLHHPSTVHGDPDADLHQFHHLPDPDLAPSDPMASLPLTIPPEVREEIRARLSAWMTHPRPVPGSGSSSSS